MSYNPTKYIPESIALVGDKALDLNLHSRPSGFKAALGVVAGLGTAITPILMTRWELVRRIFYNKDFAAKNPLYQAVYDKHALKGIEAIDAPRDIGEGWLADIPRAWKRVSAAARELKEDGVSRWDAWKDLAHSQKFGVVIAIGTGLLLAATSIYAYGRRKQAESAQNMAASLQTAAMPINSLHVAPRQVPVRMHAASPCVQGRTENATPEDRPFAARIEAETAGKEAETACMQHR